jgi:hypothetical protein
VPVFVNYKKGCTRLTAISDEVYQLLAHGRWFSPGTPASSTTKTGRHDIAEILLKVALKHQKSTKKKSYVIYGHKLKAERNNNITTEHLLLTNGKHYVSRLPPLSMIKQKNFQEECTICNSLFQTNE